jgi:hypothetical protein
LATLEATFNSLTVCFENEKAVIDACCDAWNWFEAQPQRISKLTQRHWASLAP